MRGRSDKVVTTTVGDLRSLLKPVSIAEKIEKAVLTTVEVL